MSPRAALFALAWLAGCGGAGRLSPTFPDNRAEDLARVLARASAASLVDRAVAVGLTEDPPRLYAFDLAAGRSLWEQAVSEPRTAPYLAGELVVLHEGSRVVGRRVSDGVTAFAVPDDNFQLVGAGGEGPLAAVVLSTGGGVGARARVLVVRGGAIATQLDLDAAAGSPDVRGGLVFLPWGNQNVTVLDGESGQEIARLRFLDGVVGHVRANDAGVFFGQSGVGRMAERATREATGWYQPNVAALPGQPSLWRDAYAPPAGPRSAVHKIRLAWAPARSEGGRVRASDGTLYLTFYRLVFALSQDALDGEAESEPGEVRWVYEHPADLVGAEAREGGVLLADAEGGLTFVGADGRPRWSAETGARPSVVSMRLSGFDPPGEPGPPLPPVAEQLLGVVESSDARLVPGRAYAVRLLAAQSDPTVTEHLIALCDERGLSAELRRAACDSLGGRTMSAETILASLQGRASYLAGTRAPPSGALATMAARQSERRAVPLIVGHLRDPETPVTELPALAAALAQLGDPSAVAPLRDFLWLYHAEPDDEALAAALGAVARALVALSPAARAEIQQIADAPFTGARIRAELMAAHAASAAQD